MPDYRGQIAKVLQEYGPMTAIGIAEAIDLPLLKVHRALASARFQMPGKLFKVVDYQPVNYRGADLRVYAYGEGEDLARRRYAGKRKADRRKAATKRYREKSSVERNVKNRLYKAARAGREVAVNPWAQLAPVEVRGLMGVNLLKGKESNENDRLDPKCAACNGRDGGRRSHPALPQKRRGA